jgi:hypothetical protein
MNRPHDCKKGCPICNPPSEEQATPPPVQVKADVGLLPCPFCKCDPVHQRVEEYCEGEWYVVCEVCRATGPRCDTEERARWYWEQSHANNRISETGNHSDVP